MQENMETQFNHIDTNNLEPSQVVPTLSDSDEIFDMGDNFDFGEFQVVRREFFAHLREPSLTFNNCRIYVNMAAVSKFPHTDYMQVLINRERKILALRPCKEGARDSFKWCYESKGKRKPSQITCKIFFAKVFTMMEWNSDCRYKLLGNVIHSNGEYMLAFDLTSTEVYQMTYVEGAKPKASKTPIFPAGWQNQFGMPFNEHRQSMQINVFDGYAIYAIKDNTAVKAEPDADKDEGGLVADSQNLMSVQFTNGGNGNG